MENFVALEEEKADGKIYYKKECDKKFLVQALHLMQEATKIRGEKFGMMRKDGKAEFSSWKEYLYSVTENLPENERKSCCRNIETLPEVKESSFVFTDCNMTYFVFQGEGLAKMIDVERPLWGRSLFFVGCHQKSKSVYVRFVESEEESGVVDLYAKLYPYIFKRGIRKQFFIHVILRTINGKNPSRGRSENARLMPIITIWKLSGRI